MFGENSEIELVNCNAICYQISRLAICDALVSHFQQILCVHLMRMRKFDYLVLSVISQTVSCRVSDVLNTERTNTHFTPFTLKLLAISTRFYPNCNGPACPVFPGRLSRSSRLIGLIGLIISI